MRAWMLYGFLLSACVTAGPGAVEVDCFVGYDDDGDGAVDCFDLDCNAVCGGGRDAGAPFSCNPGTCGGCCSGDVCFGGDSSVACGVGGGACVDCGPGFVCAGGACTVDGASRWNVIVESLAVPTLDASGAAWDSFGGAPDPFVEVYAGSTSGYAGATSAAADVFSVNYNQRVASGLRADAIRTLLGFRVYDEDVSAHDLVGGCYYEGLNEGAFDGFTLLLECPRDVSRDQAGFALTWRLERN